jgi:DNA segregation ATPase FtsK/SpoIIIE, S-DNA-T family
MSQLDIQQVLGARYRTSHEADGYTDKLRQNLALDTKAQVARLAIGRSLAMGQIPDRKIDASGMDIPATSLVSSENIGAWVGLLISHANLTDSAPITSMDGFRNAIRAHWHRGAIALWDEWLACGEDYEKYVVALVRRSEMPSFSSAEIAPVDQRSAHVTSSLEAQVDVSATLLKALNELGITVQLKNSQTGPRLTRYRALLMNLTDLGKLNRSVPQLSLALNLGQYMVNVSNGDEPKTVFIDVPRAKSTWSTVGINRLREWANNGARDSNELVLYVGNSVSGSDVSFDLVSAPHLLVGGTTGSGKSVCLHSLILSLLLRHKPESLQLALIDPKQVEFAPYAKLPNLYRNEIATETSTSREMLTELVTEMEARYRVFNQSGVSNIVGARKNGHRLPFIVVFIEEMADLVLQDENIEPLIARLAQKSRAAGIHLVMATQRPDSKTFSGLIRSNVPARVALTVRTSSESKIILDEIGADNLLGSGDMLVRIPGQPAIRAHGVDVHIDDIKGIVTTYAKSTLS